MQLKRRVGFFLEGTSLFEHAVWMNRLYESLYFRVESLISDEAVIRVGDSQAAIRPETSEEWRNVRRRIFKELPVMEHLEENIRPHDIFWDVGANVGVYSCVMSTLVPEGKVVAFEPYPSNVTLLRKNVEDNEAHNVQIETTALSDTRGTTELYVPQTSEGGAQEGTMISRRAEDVVDVVSVITCPGDELVREESVPSPNVVKIDVEGAGPAVLRGLETTLESADCRLVYVEPHANASQLRRQLRCYGFDVSTVDLLRDDDEDGTIVARG